MYRSEHELQLEALQAIYTQPGEYTPHPTQWNRCSIRLLPDPYAITSHDTYDIYFRSTSHNHVAIMLDLVLPQESHVPLVGVRALFGLTEGQIQTLSTLIRTTLSTSTSTDPISCHDLIELHIRPWLIQHNHEQIVMYDDIVRHDVMKQKLMETIVCHDNTIILPSSVINIILSYATSHYLYITMQQFNMQRITQYLRDGTSFQTSTGHIISSNKRYEIATPHHDITSTSTSTYDPDLLLSQARAWRSEKGDMSCEDVTPEIAQITIDDESTSHPIPMTRSYPKHDDRSICFHRIHICHHISSYTWLVAFSYDDENDLSTSCTFQATHFGIWDEQDHIMSHVISIDIINTYINTQSTHGEHHMHTWAEMIETVMSCYPHTCQVLLGWRHVRISLSSLMQSIWDDVCDIYKVTHPDTHEESDIISPKKRMTKYKTTTTTSIQKEITVAQLGLQSMIRAWNHVLRVCEVLSARYATTNMARPVLPILFPSPSTSTSTSSSVTPSSTASCACITSQLHLVVAVHGTTLIAYDLAETYRAWSKAKEVARQAQANAKPIKKTAAKSTAVETPTIDFPYITLGQPHLHTWSPVHYNQVVDDSIIWQLVALPYNQVAWSSRGCMGIWSYGEHDTAYYMDNRLVTLRDDNPVRVHLTLLPDQSLIAAIPTDVRQYMIYSWTTSHGKRTATKLDELKNVVIHTLQVMPAD